MVQTEPVYHRGVVLGSREENTMPAFNAAFDRGNCGYEADVRVSVEDTLPIIHDATWDRTTPHTGRVDATTQERIDELRTNGGSPIPSLLQVLKLGSSGGPILLDIKGDSWSDVALGRVDELVVRFNRENRVFAFTSDKQLITRMRQVCPNVRISYRPVDVGYSLEETQAMGCSAIQPTLDTLTHDRVNAFQSAGLRVIVQNYSIDNDTDLTRARNLGVDYVLIDADKWDRWT